jgi:uncharacterized alkaline shock family protein YloU
MAEKFIAFKISKVKILSFSFTHKENIEEDNSNFDELDKFEYKSSISLRANVEKGNIDVKVDVKVSLRNLNKEILNIEVLNTYLFKDLNQYQISPGKIDIPDNIIQHLMGISISNTRGALSVKVNETGFENIVLPLTKIDNLEREDKKKK